ncbi:MAG: cysteine--tRNA ligase [Candidatus Poseidoniales archaeon]
MLRFYNTATRKVENFLPIEEGKVSMYVCGLTVYNDMHLGHARTYIAFDTIRRWFEYLGNDVKFVQNHTDIDDKIIKRALEEKISTEEVANKYIERTVEDLGKLQVKLPTEMPRATDYIEEMVDIISNLISKGYAYVVEPMKGALSSDVYFDVLSASDKFGNLTGQKIEDMEAGARIAVDNRKRHSSDFVLWKGAKPGEPHWDSPWGIGRPGWHIECSAMSLNHLGPNFDIHGGGIDLKFPHHESEILQTECHTDYTPMSNYWIHSGHLTVNKEKMSKSLDNFFLVRDVMKEYSAETLRFYFLNGHYRSPIDFSDLNLKESEAAYRRLEGAYHRIKDFSSFGAVSSKELELAVTSCSGSFEDAMNDDFNTREALASLFQFSRIVNSSNLDNMSKETHSKLIRIFESFGHKVLGLFASNDLDSDFVFKIESLIESRDKARVAKNWVKSDSIREQLSELGIQIEDLPEGTKWRRV